jgi:hypothetical protein
MKRLFFAAMLVSVAATFTGCATDGYEVETHTKWKGRTPPPTGAVGIILVQPAPQAAPAVCCVTPVPAPQPVPCPPTTAKPPCKKTPVSAVKWGPFTVYRNGVYDPLDNKNQPNVYTYNAASGGVFTTSNGNYPSTPPLSGRYGNTPLKQ